MHLLKAGVLLALLPLLAASNLAPPSSELPQAGLSRQFRDGLKKQHLNVLESRGESITIMVVGESGLGKTSLLSSLFRAELLWPESMDGEPTVRIAEQTVTFDLEGVPFSARLIDTPGYGDVSNTNDFQMITGRIHSGFRRVLAHERRIRRDAESESAVLDRVDVVLYFFAPHRCKKADIALLKLLKGKASIVPILGKADSMTSDELDSFRVQVTNALIEAKVPTAHPPLAVITATRPAGGERGCVPTHARYAASRLIRTHSRSHAAATG